MRDLGRTCLAASLMLAFSAITAHAAQPRERARRRAPAVEIALEGQLGYFRMAASDSATALFGSPDTLTYGGALRVTVWRGIFLTVGARSFAKEGERVFVADPTSPVQMLGHPLTMRTTSGLFSVGYRFRHGKLIVPYASLGLALTSYSEKSEVAGESFDADTTKAGLAAAAGLEIGRGIFRFAAEVGYTSAPDAIGTGGVSRVYGETDAGGFHAIGKLVIAFGI